MKELILNSSKFLLLRKRCRNFLKIYIQIIQYYFFPEIIYLITIYLHFEDFDYSSEFIINLAITYYW